MTAAWIVLLKSHGRYFVMLTKDFSISAFETEAEALAYFEQGYNDSHARSYESSMSAAIHWMTFNPAIIRSAGLDELRGWLGSNPPFRMSHASGLMFGAEVAKELGEKLWDAGTKPRLISEGFNDIKKAQLRKQLEELEGEVATVLRSPPT